MTNLVPNVRGPKLAEFPEDISSLKFVRLLSSEENYSPNSIPHSKVFAVKIDKTQYALKVFNCISIEEIDADYPEQEHALGDKRKRVLDDDTVRYHLEPFFAECRAFGKLVKEAKDNALAVRCHGHVLLSPELELRIKEQFGIQDWNRKPADEGQPLRAIVKDLIRTDSRFGHSSFCTMRKKIEKLNRLGIYNMDIREENYRDGRLFDFSSSITSPHPDLSPNLRSMDEIVEDMEDDVECFESMVREVHKTWMGKLRPRS